MLTKKPKRYRYPAQIISHCVWLYHRFSLSYRDIEEMLYFRGIAVSYESIRQWCIKFSRIFAEQLRKKEIKRGDKWYLDEMTVKINGEKYILWRAVDSEGYELDIFIQKRRNKKAVVRFIRRLLSSHQSPRVIVTDKLRSYCKPIKKFCPKTDHRKHKGLNNRAENSHQPTRRREKSLIKMKSLGNSQKMLALMGIVRNYFAVDVGRYKNSANLRNTNLKQACETWNSTANQILCA